MSTIRLPRVLSKVSHLVLLAGLLTFFCAISEKTAFGLEQGETPPDFTLNSNQGADVQLSNFRGKVVIIDFWASWCNTCDRSLRWINELQKRLGSEKLQVLTVNLDEDRDAAIAYMKKANMNLLVAYDPSGATPEKYRVQATPTSIIVGRDGKVASIHSGFSEAKAKSMEDQVKTLMEAADKT